MKKKYFLLTAAVFLVTALVFGGTSLACLSFTKKFFRSLSYYLIALLIFYWIVTLVQAFKSHPGDLKTFSRQYGSGIIFSLLLCGIIFGSLQPDFRALQEETSLLSVSQSMAYERKPDHALTGIQYGLTFSPIQTQIPREPLLFPFLTHVLHVLIGYRDSNPFVLNFLCLGAILLLVFVWTKKQLGLPAAFIALLLIAAQPRVSVWATSAHLDLCATLFLFISLICLQSFLDSPSPLKFQMLWIHLLLAANTHGALLLFGIAIMAALFCLRAVRRDYFRFSFVFALTPFLLLPLLWQGRLIYPAPLWTDLAQAFSPRIFIAQILWFFERVVIPLPGQPHVSPVNMAGIAALVNLAFLVLNRRGDLNKNTRHFVFIVSTGLTLSWILTLLIHHVRGDTATWIQPSPAAYVLLSLLAVFLLHRFKLLEKYPLRLIALAAFLFIYYHTLAIAQHRTPVSHELGQYRQVTRFLSQQKGSHFLVITNRPNLYTIYNYSATSFEDANQNHATLLENYRTHLFQDIFVIQQIAYEDLMPKGTMRLHPDFKLEPVFEIQKSHAWLTRISRVKKPGAPISP